MIAPSSAHAYMPTVPRSRAKLLVVDDQAINIQTIYEIFQNEYEVYMAISGEQALKFCETTQPDLILLDVVMPGMNGHEVCKQLKSDSLTTNIPVIFITARDSTADESECLNEGAVDFITKPVNPAVLRARVRTHLTLKFQSDALRAMALVDGLTGVANRRHFDEMLDKEWRRCVRAGHAISLLMIDVDFFKPYNDHYGHQAGDDCLAAIGLLLKSCFSRPHDLVARYGGEEYACLLPETALEGAINKATEVKAAVDALEIPHEFSDASRFVTISVGVATISPARGDSPHQLVAMADKLLFSAKRAGRAQIHSGYPDETLVP
jgi:diguanylate cyclase (GGDEF)-like protein